MDSHYSLRFVVLHHTGIESPHFDFLFETLPGSVLSGMRLSEWPITPQTKREIGGSHRRVYLTYEGEISGDRGSVRRVAAGRCRINGDGIELDTGDRIPITPAATDI